MASTSSALPALLGRLSGLVAAAGIATGKVQPSEPSQDTNEDVLAMLPRACMETPPSSTSFDLQERCSTIGDLSAVATPASTRFSPSEAYSYPCNLVVQNTFLDFSSEATVVLQRRRTRSLEPSRRKDHDEETSISNVGVGGVSNKIAYNTIAPAVTLTAQVPRLVVLPSTGSEHHNSSNCRPCGFFWKPGGCLNGSRCEFCHICHPSEKKRRQKAKKALLKAQMAAMQAAAAKALTTPNTCMSYGEACDGRPL
eukprot:TRINITY_DN24335_c0_g1_i1.p1 TRINITY_DN24335_c0_g1~~TRINITY_DN24335_c0_g1_i1.p1  ORF type:complete len:254 (-),score=33.53 TRINITY_DN24335_c0_g1_i1:682-1443(-)